MMKAGTYIFPGFLVMLLILLNPFYFSPLIYFPFCLINYLIITSFIYIFVLFCFLCIYFIILFIHFSPIVSVLLLHLIHLLLYTICYVTCIVYLLRSGILKAGAYNFPGSFVMIWLFSILFILHLKLFPFLLIN